MRDPRIDPQPGDKLKPPRIAETRIVNGAGNGMVRFECLVLDSISYGCITFTLEEWRREMADAEVLHVAE